MKDFIFHNPDKVYFGKNQIKYLPEELLKLFMVGVQLKKVDCMTL